MGEPKAGPESCAAIKETPPSLSEQELTDTIRKLADSQRMLFMLFDKLFRDRAQNDGTDPVAPEGAHEETVPLLAVEADSGASADPKAALVGKSHNLKKAERSGAKLSPRK